MTTRYDWKLLRAGSFRLDGGSMFGLIPRTVWSRSVPTDDKGRITVQHNCLALTRPGTDKVVLIETGTGDKLDPASRDLFAMEDRSVLTALREANLNPANVSDVLVSHLHFDHAGGLTRMCQPGESPDWKGPASGMAGKREDHGVKLSFPNAKLHVQRREWDDAVAGRSVMTRTYFIDHLEPMRDRVHFLEAPSPFERWRTPDRDERPKLTLEQRMVEAADGIFTFLVPGHTWGQQAVLFQDTSGRTVVFVPDCLPTAAHVGATYSLAYDVEPYTSMLTRQWLLEAAAERNWLLVLDHEPGNPCFTVAPNGKGWWNLQPVVAG